MSCALASAIVLAYYAHPSRDFKMTGPSSGHTIEIVCDAPRRYTTCGPLGNQSTVTFTVPA